MSSQEAKLPARLAFAIILGGYGIHSFASLAHEVIWIRLLTATFGMSLTAIALVMAVFVAGLALGSSAIALASRRWTCRPIAWFGWLQAALGIWSMGLPHVVQWLDNFHVTLVPAAGSLAHFLARLAAVSAAILIPSSLIGAVFPLLSELSPQLAREQDRGPGRLYLIGLLTSAAGAAVAPILLLPRFGITLSASIVALINILLAVFALGFGNLLESTRQPARESDVETSTGPWQDLGVVAFVQGFGLFGLEVISAKVLWLSVDTTAYAEAMVFAVVLVAMGVGSGVALLLRSRRVPAVPLLCFALVFAALTQSLMIPLADRLAFGFSNAVKSTAWVTSSVTGFCTAEAMLVAMQVGLPVMFHAIAFTSLCELAVRGQDGFSMRIGRLYAWNNVGAVAGSLMTALVLVPQLGLTWSLTAVSLLLVITGGVFLLRHEQGARARGLVVGSAILTSIPVVIWGVADDITFRDFAAGPQHAVVFHHEDGLGIVEVLENRTDRSRVLRSSRLRQEGGTQPQHVAMQRMQGRLPAVLHPSPEKVLVVGLGTGISLNAMIWDGTTDVSCVEVSRGVIEAERFFRPFNGDILRNQKVRVINEDGREFVKLTRDRYDLIVQDVFFPYQSGVANLYSVEHYRRCRDKLAPRGAVGQWICINQVGTEDLKSLVRTFSSVFPHTTLWCDEIYLLLWGTLEPQSLDLKLISDRIESRGGAEQFANPGEVLARFVCVEQSAATWAAGIELNTEDNARIEFRSPLRLSELNSPTLVARNLRELQSLKQPTSSVCRIAGPDDAELLARVDRASRLYVSGLIAVGEGNLAGARRDLRASFDLNPSNLMARDWLVTDALARTEQKFRAKDLAGATEILAEADEFAPDDSRVLLNHAGILFMKGEWTEAAQKCQLVLDREPGNTRVRSLLGSIQFQAGQLADATATFRRALEDAPNDPELQRWLRRCLTSQPRSDVPVAPSSSKTPTNGDLKRNKLDVPSLQSFVNP